MKRPSEREREQERERERSRRLNERSERTIEEMVRKESED